MLNTDLLGFQDFRNPQMSVKKELKIQWNISYAYSLFYKLFQG